MAGTQGYIAPEVLMGRKASPAADMWAVGILLCKVKLNFVKAKNAWLLRCDSVDFSPQAYYGDEPVVNGWGVTLPDAQYPGEHVQDLVEGLLKISSEAGGVFSRILFISPTAFARISKRKENLLAQLTR